MKDKILSMYKEGFSSPAIAKELDVHPQKVRRTVKAAGITRSRSDAQKLAIEKGRAKIPNPTGSTWSEEQKDAIAQSSRNYWDSLTDKEYAAICKQRKQLWASKTQEERDEFYSLANEAVRKASKEGTKLEKFLVDSLAAKGWTVSHKYTPKFDQGTKATFKLECDLYVHDVEVAIEIDGPSHRVDVFGDEQLALQMMRDKKKNKLCKQRGIQLIRVKQHSSARVDFIDVSDSLDGILIDIHNGHPIKTNKPLYIKCGKDKR